jgi:formiminoglutamate deiminase
VTAEPAQANAQPGDVATRPGVDAAARFHAEHAWLGRAGGLATDVLIEVRAGRITSVTPATPAPPDAVRLAGLTLPGLANAHSHAFHRVLRGRTHMQRGSFWTWRDEMYAVSATLDPDRYFRLARAVYAEMALAGISCVGEFHYLHHDPAGHRYAEPNAMGQALIAAAAEAGIRITLLDTLYLAASVAGAPLRGPQLRFGDGDVDAWLGRLADLRTAGPVPHARIAAAIHSVRAVPPDAISAAAAGAAGVPLHVHLSEQRAENDACLDRYGRTPTQLLHDCGALGPHTTAVHATHLSDEDRTTLGDTDTAVCFCPTTERDLADGIGPARALLDAGSPLCLGSDSHAVIDMFEEARALELDERLRTERRGHFLPAELLDAITIAGHASLGWNDAGVLAPGQRADLVSLALTSVRTAGAHPIQAAIFAASAADVRQVIIDGVHVVRDGRHMRLDVAAELAMATAQVEAAVA